MRIRALTTKAAEGAAIWFWFCVVVSAVWTVVAFAAAANLPNVSWGQPLESSAWNEMVSRVNSLSNAAANPAPSWLGVSQTWQDVTASRTNDTTYTNDTGKPIYVSVSTLNSNTVSAQWAFVDGMQVALTWSMSDRRSVTSFVVPSGSSYYVGWNGSNVLVTWAELR